MKRFDLIELGNRLKQLRCERGLSRKKVANDTYMSEMTLTHYERADYMASILNIVILAEYYGVSLEWLCYGESEG